MVYMSCRMGSCCAAACQPCGLAVQAAPGQPWDQWAYNAWLAEQCGPDVAPPEKWRTELLGSACQGILSRPDTFRDVWPDSDLPLYAAADMACLAMLKQKLGE